MSHPALTAQLKPGREKPVAHGHPWIFSGALAGWEGEPALGAVADVRASDGRWLARGLAHPAADLALRLFTWREEEALDEDLLRRRLDEALGLRDQLFRDRTDTDSYRLVFSESDGLSGLIIDRYADALAVRIGSAALAPRLPALLAHLAARTGSQRIVVRADKDAIAREGLDAEALARLSTADAATVAIRENGFTFEVDLAGGQKTGFYLDQRENRARVAALAKGRRVLSAYCYTGAFEVCAAAAGAPEILGLDGSEPALAQARRHHELNRSAGPVEYRVADVPVALRRFRDERRTFDLIILDPPRFVFTQAQKDKGLRAYKDINLLALKLLTPGGLLATFSCSGLVSTEDLKRVIGWAAQDSGRTVRLLETLSQPADHPVRAGFPEGEYLSGLIVHAA